MHLFELSILDAINLGLVNDEKQAVEIFDRSFNLIEEILSKNSFLPYSSGPFNDNQNKMKEYRLNVVKLQDSYLNDLGKKRQDLIIDEYEKLIKAKENAI